jgi:hypothetical protein
VSSSLYIEFLIYAGWRTANFFNIARSLLARSGSIIDLGVAKEFLKGKYFMENAASTRHSRREK